MAARILVIEDNLASLDLLIYLLKAFGYTPFTAQDGEEGLEIVRQEELDLIICDVQLPKLDGYEVARWLKSHPRLRTIPLIAVTALAMVGDRDKVLAAGFNGYIAKPISPDTFVGEVEKFLRFERGSMLLPSLQSTVQSAPLQSKGATILVVDNAPVNLELARSILEPCGYTVITATGISEGLSRARQTHPDLILSDVNMSGGTGYDFIKLVKADPQLHAVPFVFITSTFVDASAQARGLALGAAKFILRPIEPRPLLAAIEDCLRAEKQE